MKSSNRSGFPSKDKPWLKHYRNEAIVGDIPELTIYEYMVQNNKSNLHKTAINYLGKKITYQALIENIHAVARSLVALNVKERDIVTVALPSVPESLYVIYALNLIGAVANMIHPLAGEAELVDYIMEVNSKVCIILDKTYDAISNALESTNVKHTVVVTAADSMPFVLRTLYNFRRKKVSIPNDSRTMTWSKFIKDGYAIEIPGVHKNCYEPAIISHTGGTTGEPKGVMCSDRNINSLIWQVIHSFSLVPNGRILAVLPPFVNYSLVHNMLEGFALGFEVQLIPMYEPDKFPYYVKKYRPNYIHTIPAYLEVLLKNDKIRNADLSCIIQIYYGGEAMGPHTEEAVNNLLISCGMQNKIGTGLGATETTGAATCAVGNTVVPGGAGIPFPKVNCKIVEPGTECELTYQQEGEVCFSGETVMLGYYNNKSATDDIIKIHDDNQRWLYTGDLGYMNQDGILFVTGRIKRLIMTRDSDSQVTKIFPDRVEKVILSHPAVELCCVIGIPDEEYINYAEAVILLEKSFVESEQLTKQIISLCRSKLPAYMVPRKIMYRSSLPRTERGKVDYRVLQEEMLQG